MHPSIIDKQPKLPIEALHGIQPERVISAIRDRAQRWKQGDLRPDGRKIGLVIEGGAMRSVHSAGGAVALAELGFSNLFDSVYATSAGVMNASYFLSGQPMIGITVYYESCVSPLFLNPFRVWKILDIDYLFDRVIRIDKPLDTAKVQESRTDFFVAMLNMRTGAPLLVDTKKTSTPLLDVLKAATAMPVLYNRSVPVDGEPCMDGGLAIPFPLRQALEHGCTDVLVLLTRHPEYRSRPAPLAHRFAFDAICARGNSTLSRVYADHHLPANDYRDLALGRQKVSEGISIATLCVPAGDSIGRTTSHRHALRGAAMAYGQRVMDLFSEEDRALELP